MGQAITATEHVQSGFLDPGEPEIVDSFDSVIALLAEEPADTFSAGCPAGAAPVIVVDDQVPGLGAEVAVASLSGKHVVVVVDGDVVGETEVPVSFLPGGAIPPGCKCPC